MNIFIARYRMSGRRWFRLLGLSIIFNVVVCAAAFPFGLGLLFFPFALMVGASLALVPAVITIAIAAFFAAVRGHFSFLQLFVIGTLVSCFLAQRLIQAQNDLLLDNIFHMIPALAFAWVGGWVVAHVLDVLPVPMPEGDGPLWTPGTILTVLASLLLIVVPVMVLAQNASQAIEAREVARATEQRGNCPEGLECSVSVAAGYRLDPRVFAIRMAGRRFLVPANNIYSSVQTSPSTPGEANVIMLRGLLPDFEPRSSANSKAFSFPSRDIGYAIFEPECSVAGYCRSVPSSLGELEKKTADAKQPVFIRTKDAPSAPAGLDYIGDITSFSPHSTNAETADTHVYRTEQEGEYILCRTAHSAALPSCKHTLVWEGLLIELRYQRPWLDDWLEIRASVINRIAEFERADAPPNVVHLVDRLGKAP